MDPSPKRPSSLHFAVPVDVPRVRQETHDPLGAVALPILANVTTTGSTPLAPERVQRREPFVFAYSWEQEGESFVFKQVLTDKEIKELNLKQYPFLQMNFSDIKHLVNNQGFAPTVFLKKLGILIDTGAQTLRFPTKNVLEEKLKELSIVQVSEILAFKEFLELMLTNDIIFSDPPHLIHDVCFHIIPLLVRLSKYPDGYKPYKEMIFSTFSELSKEFEYAKENFRNFIAPVNLCLLKRKPITEEEWKLFESLLQFGMGACLDILSADGGPFLQGKELKEHLFTIQSRVLRDEMWLEAWQKESPLNEKDTETMRDILSDKVQNRPTDILKAIYARPFFRELERIKVLLTEQFDMARKNPEAFLTSLDKRLDPPVEKEHLSCLPKLLQTIESSLLNRFLDFLPSTLIVAHGWLDHEDLGSSVAHELYRTFVDSLNELDYDLFLNVVVAMLKKPL